MNSFLSGVPENGAPTPFQAPEELVLALSAQGEPREVERGEAVFTCGADADGVYLIRSGTVRASLPGDAGGEMVCRVLGPGSVLGLPAAICAKKYEFDVEALDVVKLVYLKTTALNEVLRTRPALCMRVVAMMCDELTALRQTRDHLRSCHRRDCSLHPACKDHPNNKKS